MFRMLVKLVGVLLHEEIGEEARADMYLPEWLLAFGAILAAVGIGGTGGSLFFGNFQLTIITLIVLGVGILAILCWKNQKINVVSEESFVYTTFMGNRYEYRFDEITGLRSNSDSMTMFVGGRKVHIESCAILSERLVNGINAALQELEKQNSTKEM